MNIFTVLVVGAVVHKIPVKIKAFVYFSHFSFNLFILFVQACGVFHSNKRPLSNNRVQALSVFRRRYVFHYWLGFNV